MDFKINNNQVSSRGEGAHVWYTAEVVKGVIYLHVHNHTETGAWAYRLGIGSSGHDRLIKAEVSDKMVVGRCAVKRLRELLNAALTALDGDITFE